MAAKVKVNQAEMARFRRALGLGMLNFSHAVEAKAKREAPVRGGYRSFMTTKRGKAGQVLIGGTLRRSIHSAVYVDGKPVSGSGQADENGKAVPRYAPAKGVVGYVGTNSDYGAYVEIGTTRMPDRPFLGPAFDGTIGELTPLLRAGMKRGGF